MKKTITVNECSDFAFSVGSTIDVFNPPYTQFFTGISCSIGTPSKMVRVDDMDIGKMLAISFETVLV